MKTSFAGRTAGQWIGLQSAHRFKDLAEKAGFEGLRFHKLRHTHATLLLSQGVHPKIVQERLGHETINIRYLFS